MQHLLECNMYRSATHVTYCKGFILQLANINFYLELTYYKTCRTSVRVALQMRLQYVSYFSTCRTSQYVSLVTLVSTCHTSQYVSHFSTCHTSVHDTVTLRLQYVSHFSACHTSSSVRQYVSHLIFSTCRTSQYVSN